MKSTLRVCLTPPHSLTNQRDRRFYQLLDDHTLIVASQSRDKQAFEELIKRFEKTVYGMLRSMAPDFENHSDLAQEVFFRLWTSLPALRRPQIFRVWLKRVVKHIFFDDLKRRKRQIVMSLDVPIACEDGDGEPREIPDRSRLPEDVVHCRQLAVVIDSAIGRLPAHYKEAMVLRDCQGLSYEEIAETISCEVGTVKSRIFRARAQVQKAVEKYGYLDCA